MTEARSYREISIAGAVGAALIGGAFAAAALTSSYETLFSLQPAVDGSTRVAPLDIPAGRVFAFHATFYTVWATMFLTLPAFCTVWFIRRSPSAASWWRAFWTVGFAAMLVHLYLAIGVLFQWNWQHALHDTVRVTIPIPDLVLTAWWGTDVALGWFARGSRSTLIHAQRLVIHVLLLVIFLLGFIKEGELPVSKSIGIVAALAVTASLAAWIKRRR